MRMYQTGYAGLHGCCSLSTGSAGAASCPTTKEVTCVMVNSSPGLILILHSLTRASTRVVNVLFFLVAWFVFGSEDPCAMPGPLLGDVGAMMFMFFVRSEGDFLGVALSNKPCWA